MGRRRLYTIRHVGPHWRPRIIAQSSRFWDESWSYIFSRWDDLTDLSFALNFHGSIAFFCSFLWRHCYFNGVLLPDDSANHRGGPRVTSQVFCIGGLSLLGLARHQLPLHPSIFSSQSWFHLVRLSMGLPYSASHHCIMGAYMTDKSMAVDQLPWSARYIF